MLGFVVAVLTLFVCAADATKVGVLASHNPSGCGSSGSQAVVECNLKVYSQAIDAASKAGVEMLILPEGYGLVGSPSKTSFYEPLAVTVGSRPCAELDAAAHPVQAGLGCASSNHSIAVAANFFSRLQNGTNHITEVVYDATGTVVAVYHKHQLFPVEEPKNFAPGPFAPTVFRLNGRTWGIAICYEGFYPTITGNWQQFDALKRQGASALAWSVGSGPVSTEAPLLAKRYNISVFGTADGGKENMLNALVGPDGKPLPYTDIPVTAEDLAASAPFVRASLL